MKWVGIYLIGYIFLIGGIALALWKWGFLDQIGPFWSLVSVLILVGIGVMVAVANSGRKESIEIDSE